MLIFRNISLTELKKVEEKKNILKFAGDRRLAI